MSNVYFTDFNASMRDNLLDKFKRLILKSQLLDKIQTRNMVAIKIHFGEQGNLATIRPNYVHLVAELLKEKEAMPFLTDANTIYTGHRFNAIDHIKTAFLNGYTYTTTGVPIIIADGLKGHDFEEIEVNQKNCKYVKIGTAIAQADFLIVMTHFKGHEQTGFGGAIKNTGMGCGSRAGKLEMHCTSKPFINTENCVGCGFCAKICKYKAISIKDKKAVINYEECKGCGQCTVECKFKGIGFNWDESIQILLEKISEYTYGTLKDKNAIFINFLNNISPNCDCWRHNEIPITSDIGILVSDNPVAIDQASCDLINQAPANPSSPHYEELKNSKDKFKTLSPHADWDYQLTYSEKIGLGQRKYDLIKI